MVRLMPMCPKTTASLALFKSRLVLSFWYRLTQVVQEKRPLNGCSSSSSILNISSQASQGMPNCVAPPNCLFPRGNLGPHIIHGLVNRRVNSISIGSAVFVELTVMAYRYTDRHTDSRVATRPDFPGCPRFVPCCPVFRQDQPRDAKYPGFQGTGKMMKIITITIVTKLGRKLADQSDDDREISFLFQRLFSFPGN